MLQFVRPVGGDEELCGLVSAKVEHVVCSQFKFHSTSIPSLHLSRYAVMVFRSETPFTLRRIVPVDMFPQTRHYEWVLLFTR